MNRYDPKSCNPLAKVFYRPIEVAIRWCGLIDETPMILDTMRDNLIPHPAMFPQWPCLVANCERIVHALQNGDLPQARNGIRTVDHVTPTKLTVLHTDLKAWMTTNFPDQKPPFLFDEIERATHQAINADSFRALQADRDAARADLSKANEWWNEHAHDLESLKAERDALLAMVEKAGIPGERSETTYLNIIAALANALADAHPGTMKKSNGGVLVGTSKDTGDSGIVGHLISKGYAVGVKRSALESHIGKAIKGE